MPSDFHFPQTDNLNATPGEPNFFQTFDIPNLCPAPFAIDAFLASPSNAERVDILTTPNTDLSSLYLVGIRGDNGVIYLNLPLTGSSDGDGSYILGASTVTERDQAIPNGSLRNTVASVGIYTRDIPVGSSVASITFFEEVCGYVAYQNNTTILFEYETAGGGGKQDKTFDLAAHMAFMKAAAEAAGPEEEDATLPTDFALAQNYPNPFNPTTAIQFALPEAADVSLVVYDLLGRAVQELVAHPMETGTHTVTFDASGLPSGMYVYRLVADDFVQTKRMMLLK